MTEMRKIYDENFHPMGYYKERGETLSPEEYYLVAGSFVISEGKLLVTQRAEGKEFAHKWEFTMGSVVEDETGKEGALRELEEEVGIKASGKELQFLGQAKENRKFSEIYLLIKSVDNIQLQKEEVEDFQWIDQEKLDKMLEDGFFAKPMEKRIRTHYKTILEHIKKEG